MRRHKRHQVDEALIWMVHEETKAFINIDTRGYTKEDWFRFKDMVVNSLAEMEERVEQIYPEHARDLSLMQSIDRFREILDTYDYDDFT